MSNATSGPPGPALTVAIPNYNGGRLLAANLPSLFEAIRLAGVSAEVLVVDDASTDDSLTVLAQIAHKHPLLRTVSQSRNGGFASTCNRAIAEAQAPMICLANTDVTFDPDFFSAALAPLLSGAADIVKGPIHNFSTDRSRPHHIDTLTCVSLRRGLARAEPIEKAGCERSNAIAKLGCCFVARTEALREVGGYDLRYSPYYWEDVDLGWRMAEQGYRLTYVDLAVVYHQESATIGRLDLARHGKVWRIRTRNRLLFTWSLLRGVACWTYPLWELSRLISRALEFRFQYHRAFFDALLRRNVARG